MTGIRGLLIDFGGVLTSSLGEAFEIFCAEEGIDHGRLREVLRVAYHDEDPEHFVSRIETGRIEVAEFERLLAEVLSEGLERPIEPGGLVRRMVSDMEIDLEMVDLVRRARTAGIRTALVSNSWGLHYYPTELLAELFDAVVISGEVGLRKPGPEIYLLAAERLGLEPAACVFVDDFHLNVAAAERLGMRGYLHEETARSVKELDPLLGLDAAGPEHDLSTPGGAWERRDEVQFLDVREPFEWDAGAIAGAVHVPLQQLLTGAGPDLDPGRPVVAYCSGGHRSEVARHMLLARGFDAHNLEGGLHAWVDAGLPLLTPSGDPGQLV